MGHFRLLVSDLKNRIEALPPYEGLLVLLKGDLGVGKTTLVQELLESFGLLKGTVLSPTFLKIIEHKVPKLGRVLHMDCYRMDDVSDVEKLDLASYEDTRVWLVEWPDILLKFLRNHPSLLKHLGFTRALEVTLELSRENSDAARHVSVREVSIGEF